MCAMIASESTVQGKVSSRNGLSSDSKLKSDDSEADEREVLVEEEDCRERSGRGVARGGGAETTWHGGVIKSERVYVWGSTAEGTVRKSSGLLRTIFIISIQLEKRGKTLIIRSDVAVCCSISVKWGLTGI